MSWLSWALLRRLSCIVGLSALCAGCFQPLYADKTINGGPGMLQTLSGVSVKQIEAQNGTPEARLAVEVRNQLLFDLTGGGGSLSPTHELTVHLSTTRNAVITDFLSQRPTAESFGLDARYELKDLSSGKTVLRSSTFARATYDIPATGQQRFVRLRGLRDAENRAAKLIADNIRNRLASYFTAGG